MTLFEKWKRAARHRFKAAYKRTLQIERAKMKKQIEALKDEHRRRILSIQDQMAHAIHTEREKSVALAREVARVRMEFGPEQFGTRFTLYATMGERFVMHSRDLKDHMAYIVEVLASMIKREFSQIDFSRVKPIDPRPGDKYPVFRIDPKSHDDMRSW